MDFARLDAKTDADIAADVARDPDAVPIFTDALFDRVQELIVEPKRVPISLKVEGDVLAFYKSRGPGYQTRMNAVLRAYMEQETRKKRSLK